MMLIKHFLIVEKDSNMIDLVLLELLEVLVEVDDLVDFEVKDE